MWPFCFPHRKTMVNEHWKLNLKWQSGNFCRKWICLFQKMVQYIISITSYNFPKNNFKRPTVFGQTWLQTFFMMRCCKNVKIAVIKKRKWLSFSQQGEIAQMVRRVSRYLQMPWAAALYLEDRVQIQSSAWKKNAPCCSVP